jgi:hypothetical protein
MADIPLIDVEYATRLIEDQVNPLDPVDWIKKSLRVDLWSKQREIIRALQDYKNVAVQSGHGVGKSFTAAVAAVWWVATHPADDVMVVTTAPSVHQVSAILWEDIRKLHRQGELAGEVQRRDRWLIGNTLVGFGRKPQDYDKHAFQGIHRKYVLVILDEACGIDEWMWISALAITTGAHCRILAIGNPDDPTSYFSKVCKPGSGWHNIQISVLDSPYFTGEPVSQNLLDQLTDESYLHDMEKEVGKDSPIWTSKILGKFPEIDEFSVIPLGWIYEAQRRWNEWDRSGRPLPNERGLRVIGADIARFGLDKTAFAERVGDIVINARRMPKKDTQGTAELLKQECKDRGTLSIIDTNGVGAGVFDEMRKSGYYTLPFNAANRTSLKDSSGQIEFYNLRAAATWRLRELLDPARGSTVCLPPDDDLATDLATPRWKNIAGGKIVIDSKDDIRKRIGRSPDIGDAVTMAFWRENASVLIDSGETSFDWREPDDGEEGAAVAWEEPSSAWELV